MFEKILDTIFLSYIPSLLCLGLNLGYAYIQPGGDTLLLVNCVSATLCLHSIYTTYKARKRINKALKRIEEHKED